LSIDVSASAVSPRERAALCRLFAYALPRRHPGKARRKDVYGSVDDHVVRQAQLLRGSDDSDTVFVGMHPIGAPGYLPAFSHLARRGHHVIACGTRYTQGDAGLQMESALVDLAECVRDARQRWGYRRVVLVGWSGGMARPGEFRFVTGTTGCGSAPVRQIDIREVALRDGLQLEAPLEFAAKRQLLEAIACTGVRRVEATAFVSPRAVPSMADAPRIGELIGAWPEITWSALVPNLEGARRGLAAGFTNLEFVISASDSHSLANVGRPSSAMLDAVPASPSLSTPLEAASKSSWQPRGTAPSRAEPRCNAQSIYAHRLSSAAADELCLGDTIGTTAPDRVTALLAAVTAAVPGTDVGARFHDTRGAGIASAWSAAQSGVVKLDASVGGLGGCPFAPGATGNIATEELVYLLQESSPETGIDLDAVLAAAALAQELVGHPLDSKILRAGGRLRPLGARTDPRHDARSIPPSPATASGASR
jgi:hydroxymethylglutaryl-CoA lyase